MAFNTGSSQSLFGQPQQQTTSLFGNPTQPQPSPFMSQQQPQSQPSLFASQSSLFASQPSMFNSQPSLFPSQPQPNSFLNPQSTGWPSSSFPNQQQQQFQQHQQQQQQQLQQQQQHTLPTSLLQLVESLNPLHPSSPFQAALYNVVPASVLPRYTRPPTIHASLWQAALAANPDPSRQVPVPANGFDDLHKRKQTQSARVKDHVAVLTSLQADISSIQHNVTSQLTTKLAAYRRRHRELARKLLRVAATVEMAASRADSSPPLFPVESDRRKRLETIAQAIATPAEFKDKLSDLVEVSSATVMDRALVTPVVIRDPKSVTIIRQLLTDQLNGIQHLGNVCTKIDRDVSIMNNAMQQR